MSTYDAADAVVAALGSGVPSGIYDVVDDEPLHRRDSVAALAVAVGVPVPDPASANPELPPELSVMLRSQRVSNPRLCEASGWRPSSPSAREGWRFVVDGWRRHGAGAGAGTGADRADRAGRAGGAGQSA